MRRPPPGPGATAAPRPGAVAGRPSSSVGSRRRPYRARRQRRFAAAHRPGTRSPRRADRPATATFRPRAASAHARLQAADCAPPTGAPGRMLQALRARGRRNCRLADKDRVSFLTMTETPGAATPTDIELDSSGRRLRFAWGDGRRSDYDWEYLRWRCPCATCSGEGEYPGELQGRTELLPDETEMIDLDLVGRYA